MNRFFEIGNQLHWFNCKMIKNSNCWTAKNIGANNSNWLLEGKGVPALQPIRALLELNKALEIALSEGLKMDSLRK